MDQKKIVAELPSLLLPWYEENHRQLPWRQDKEPYHIWISEIMLQQTRVEAVKGYYARFLQVLPDVAALANCDDDLLHKLWEGLGYYTRVRNLKKAAQQIMLQHSGVFPADYTQILALPGIGTYTAGAICSIAFDKPTPAVDGNVLRVIARLTDDNTPIDLPVFKKSVHTLLEGVYPERAGDFTQALMELGATVCGPNRPPACESCPCRGICLGYQRGTAPTLPVKSPKGQRRVEEYTVFILSCDGMYAVEKRKSSGLLAGLWQFPNVSGKLDISAVLEQVEEFGLKPKEIIRQVERKHIFTHVQWDMCGIYVETRECNRQFQWMTSEQIQKQVALPTAFKMFWDELFSEKFLENPSKNEK